MHMNIDVQLVSFEDFFTKLVVHTTKKVENRCS